MKNLNDYIEDAKTKQGIKSDRKLCEAIKVSPTAVTFYKNKGVLPTDDVMMRIAELGVNDIETALIDLNIWRSPAPAQKIYRAMFEKLSMLCICVTICEILYITENLRLFLRNHIINSNYGLTRQS